MPLLKSPGASPAFGRTRGSAPRSFVRLFKPRFAALVEAGTKTQTVRPTPKRMPKPGDIISLRTWTGKPYRSKQRTLRESVITRVALMRIDAKRYIWTQVNPLKWQTEDSTFARLDGFADEAEMCDWFAHEHGLPFAGVLICWQNTKAD
jgi:hypothetical protein